MSDLSELVKCGVCMESYDLTSRVPLLLSCTHSFCQGCISSLNRLVCPICRTEFSGPLSEIPKNRYILEYMGNLVKVTKEGFNANKPITIGTIGRNLLKNPCGEEKFKYWCDRPRSYYPLPKNILNIPGEDMHKRRMSITELINDYNKKYLDTKTALGFAIETVETRMFNGAQFRWQIENRNVLKNFETNRPVVKYQVIDLEQNPSSEISQLKLMVTEDLAAHKDCVSPYSWQILLVNEELEIVDEFAESVDPPRESKWKRLEHVFSISKPIQYIIFAHGGTDLQNWAAINSNWAAMVTYGPKMTNGLVQLYLE